jgi:hypothetical protein
MEKFYIKVLEDFRVGSPVKGIEADVMDMSGNTIDKNVFVNCGRYDDDKNECFELSKFFKVEMEKEGSHYVLCKFIGSMPEDVLRKFINSMPKDA